MTIKDSNYVKINSVNPLYFIINKVTGYFEEINGNEYLALVSTNESKEKIKKYEELLSKIKELIKSITKNLEICDESYMKIKFKLDYRLPLKKVIEIPGMVIVVRAVFYENNKFIYKLF